MFERLRRWRENRRLHRLAVPVEVWEAAIADWPVADESLIIPELTEAMQKAMQHLMDDGTWKAILDSWGVEDAALTTAELNPSA